MLVEYQINVEYADGTKSGNLSYKFENTEVRNKIFTQIVSDFSNEKVEMDHLRQLGGVTIQSYDYYEPNMSTLAPFVPHASFRIEVLNNIIDLLEEKSINNSTRYKK